MSVFLITYDLNKPGQDYEKILGVIKGCDYAELCESSYVVDIEDLDKFYEKISAVVDKSTAMYIFNLTDSIYLSLPSSKETAAWLHKHL